MQTPKLIHITQLPKAALLKIDQQNQRIIDMAMTSEDRQRVHRRITASDGQSFAVKLPTGSVLSVGQVLYSSDDIIYRITAAVEDVLTIQPRTLDEAAFVGHLIGNLHRDIDIVEGEIIALWNAPLEQKISKAKLAFKRDQRPFKGRPAGEHSH